MCDEPTSSHAGLGIQTSAAYSPATGGRASGGSSRREPQLAAEQWVALRRIDPQALVPALPIVHPRAAPPLPVVNRSLQQVQVAAMAGSLGALVRGHPDAAQLGDHFALPARRDPAARSVA